MKINNGYYFEAGGYEFECEMIDAISFFANKEWGPSAVKFSTEKQDRFEGTDLFLLGIPVDVTMAFERKNRIRKLESLSRDGVDIHFGVRFGNGKVSFKTPVLVIGVETALGITKNNMWLAIDGIKSNISEILNEGMDRYFTAVE